MKNKIAGILVAAIFLLSLIAGAVALPTHAVNVKPYDESSTVAPDSIAVTGTESFTWTGDGSKSHHSFYLLHGTYTVAVKKAGYQDFVYRNLVIDDNSPAALSVYYSLTPTTPPPPPPTGGTGGTDGTGGTGDGATASAGMVIKSLDFDDETKPNSDVEFTVELKNSWVGTDGKGIDAREVTVHLTIVGIDDGSDVTEDLEFGAMDYKDTEEQTVSLHVPIGAEDKDFTVSATASWENKDSVAFQSQTPVTKALTVERAEHDVAVTSVEFDEGTLTVGDDSQVAVSLANIGKDDEDVRVRIQSDVLGISAASPSFKLRESKETTQYVPFELGKDVKTGKYPVTITVSFGSESASQTAVLNVNAKAAPHAQSPVTVTPVTTTVQDSGQKDEGSRPDANALAGLAVLILVIAIVAAYFARRNKPSVIVEKRRGGK